MAEIPGVLNPTDQFDVTLIVNVDGEETRIPFGASDAHGILNHAITTWGPAGFTLQCRPIAPVVKAGPEQHDA